MSYGLMYSGIQSAGVTRAGVLQGLILDVNTVHGKLAPQSSFSLIVYAISSRGRLGEYFGAVYQESTEKEKGYSGRRSGRLLRRRHILSIHFQLSGGICLTTQG